MLLKFRKERLKDGKFRGFYSVRYLLGSDGLTSLHFYLLQIGQKVEILLMYGPLLVLRNILEGNNRFRGWFELHVLPLTIIRKHGVLHYNQMYINDMVIFQNISRFVDIDLHHSFVGLAGVHLNRPVLPVCVHLQHALPSLLLPDLQRAASWGRDDDHGLVGVVFVHGFADIEAILMGNVVILPQFLTVKVLLLNLSIDACDIEIDPLLFRIQFLQFLAHVHNLPLDLRVFVAANPLYGVFLQFLNIIDALEHIGDVVNPPLLHA